ncbi:MAG: class I SAM-dependent methyltransferase [Patescibacteria group bacterium]|nr:class I SAM-dependent methyltransferase [Patescibacteria group bacterium]
MNLRAWFQRRYVNEIVKVLVEDDRKCQELIRRVEADYEVKVKLPDSNSIPSCFLVDMLERAFTTGKIVLPPKITVLDFGCGDWFYAPFLLGFLKHWQGFREVCLEGIDFPSRKNKRSLRRLQKGEPDLRVHWGDIMNLSQENKYDIIFASHMVASPHHCKMWGVPYYKPSMLFSYLQSLGKPDCLFVVIAYEYAGEDAIFRCFKSKLTEFFYQPLVEKKFSSFLYNRRGFHDNSICISRSPFVDLEACARYEEKNEEMDAILY